MAVYTQVSDDALAEFLHGYDVGEVREFKAITAGVQNSNYFLATADAKYILTLYEDKENGVAEADLPFFLKLLQHLGERNFPSPTPLANKDGALYSHLCDRPASLTSFLAGQSVKSPKPPHCEALGAAMAELHCATQDFSERRDNAQGLANWEQLFSQCAARADEITPNLAGEIETELARLQKHYSQNLSQLPQGIIHADMFPDNVFFEQGKLSGVIDFYFACNDFYAYDLAIALNAWCFESDATFNITKARGLLRGYQSRRPLTAEEIAALPILAAGAAMRFLLTRIYDWLHHQNDALVVPKNPIDYLRRLRFHKSVSSAADYGIGER